MSANTSSITNTEQGCFISFEGIEGVGKSTQCKRLKSFLESHNKEVVLTREPGGTPLAERIRSIVLDSEDEIISGESELLLMFAARSIHLRNLIIPALARGAWVICDRFTDATLAYQGYGRGQSLESIYSLAHTIHADHWPAKTLLLDAPIDVGLERVAQRVKNAGESNRFDREKQEFFSRVQQGYHALAREHPNRISIINANQSIDQVSMAIQSEVIKLF